LVDINYDVIADQELEEDAEGELHYLTDVPAGAEHHYDLLVRLIKAGLLRIVIEGDHYELRAQLVGAGKLY
jgi:hypothetical protein